MSDQPMTTSIDRRDFGRLTFGAVAAAAAGSGFAYMKALLARANAEA